MSSLPDPNPGSNPSSNLTTDPDSLILTCLCSRINHQLSPHLPPKHTLPILTQLCHCNSCRHTSGAVALSFIPLSSQPPESLISQCALYKSSPPVYRYFCPTCGTHVLFYDSRDDSWAAIAGAVERAETRSQIEKGEGVGGGKADIIQIDRHEVLSDTVDWGIAGRLSKIDGIEIPCYAEFASSGAPPIETPENPKTGISEPADVKEGEKLEARCHCGGVEFHITRPSKHLGYELPEETSQHITMDKKTWLRAGNTKYMAKMCVCRSCRLAFGSALPAWSYVPLANVRSFSAGTDTSSSGGTEMNFTTAGQLGTLKMYESSKDVFRHFCSRCGATVFWYSRARLEGEYAMVDIAVGLFRANEGIRCERWLEWWFDMISWLEEGWENGKIVKALKEGSGK